MDEAGPTPSPKIKREAVNSPNYPTTDPLYRAWSIRPYAVKSSVARIALAQWNDLNSAVRRQVYATKWCGKGGFAKCEGTTKEEALQNMALREKITCHPTVTKYYRKFVLEDGVAIVLDSALAFAQIKQCLNDFKRNGRVLSDTDCCSQENHTGKDAISVTASSDLAQSCNESGSKKEDKETTPVQPRVTGRRRVMPAKQSSVPATPSRKAQPLTPVECNTVEDTRCDMELRRARNVKRNLEMLHDLELGSKVDLLDEDAYAIGISYFSPSLTPHLTTKLVLAN